MNDSNNHFPGIHVRAVRWALIVALLAYGALLWIYRADVAGGADSSGYLNAARLLSHGAIRVEPRIPPGVSEDPRIFKAFIPFGFRAGLDDRTMVPVYSIGLPIQMAAATMVLGEAHGPFVIVPLLAILGVALVYKLGRQFGLPRSGAAFGAMVLAASPIYVFQGLQPMSDLPSTVWVLAAIVAALEAHRDPRFSFLAGFAFGLAVVTRPTSTLAVLGLLFAMPWNLRSFVLVGLGGLPWAAFLLGFNTLAYGNPFQTGYGSNSQAAIYMSLGFLPERLRHYALWMAALFTPWLLAGWFASPAVRSIDPSDARC
ncbi:MAG: glycosyltransferase family 39 protein [Deltaproteobacteria bacterium]|nr:glycosyltransferase family 39 protein [Deltaproteobacteria bacterium]